MIESLTKNSRYLENPGININFNEEKWAVMLLNMGGPEKSSDVRSYLYNIFSDRNIIKFPLSSLIQKPLAKFIASRRSPRVSKRYEAIGGGSPLLKWTRLAASGVGRELSRKYPQVEMFVGMRYTDPFIGDELDSAVDEGCRHIVLLSLYPQYCQATTGTALAEAADWLENAESDISLSVISDWHDRGEYIALLRNRIDRAFEQIGHENGTVVFSAHSIPQKLADSGDPYLDQIKKTAALAGEGYDYHLSLQSRTGPVKWIGPETLDTIRRLGRDKVANVIVVPISFVSDHIETLYEIDIELKEVARKAGIVNLIRTESLNDDTRFVDFLSALVIEKITGVE